MNSSCRPQAAVARRRPQRKRKALFGSRREAHAHPLADAIVPPLRARQALPAHLDDVRDQDRPVGRANEIRAIEIEIDEDGGIGRLADRLRR